MATGGVPFARRSLAIALSLFGLAASAAASPVPAGSATSPAAGSLTVQLQTRGAAGGPFTFNLSSGVLASPQHGTATTTTDGSAIAVMNVGGDVPPGTYALRQDLAQMPTDPAGGAWAFTDVTCDGAQVVVDAATGSAQIALDPGARATCVATDTWIAGASASADAGAQATAATPDPAPSSTSTTPADPVAAPTAAPVADPPIAPAALGPAFTCTTPAVFISQSTGTGLILTGTQLKESTFANNTATFINVGTSTSTVYNAIGYNPSNNYIYATTSGLTTLASGIGHLVQIGSDGVPSDLGLISGLPANQRNPYSGAFDGSGNYYIAIGGASTVYRVNLNTVAATGVTLTGNSWAPADMAFSSGFFWGVDGSYVYRMNPTTGAVSRFAAPSGVASGTYGAAWFFANGNFGISNNDTGRIYQISITNPAGTPTFSVVSSYAGPSTPAFNDGTTCIPQPTDLQIVKTGPAIVSPNGTITWTLTVRNNGPGNSSGYVVNDTVPSAVTNVTSPTPGCTVTGNVLQCVQGTLNSGQSFAITLTGRAPPTNGTCFTNTGLVAANESDPTPGNNTSSVQTCTTPGITIDKTASVATFSTAGTTITYSYLVTNTSTTAGQNMTAVHVTDPLPGLSAVTCPVTTLAPGASTTCTATYTVTQADVDRGFISNTGTAIGTPPSGPNASAQDSLVIPAVQTPAITMTKTPSVSIFSAPGVPVTYDYLVTNTGNVTLTSVNVTDPLPGLSAVNCPVATLAPGASTTCTATYTTTQADVDAGHVTNTAVATGTPPFGPAISAQSVARIPATQTPSIDIVKSADIPSFSAANTLITYTYIVRNTGNVTLQNVGVTDPLAGLRAGARAVTCPQTTLAPGASLTCTATYRTSQADVDAGSVFNTGTASGTAPNGATVTDESSVTVPATQTANISIVKTADVPSFATAGVLVTYSYTVTNTGNVSLAPVTVADPRPGLSGVDCPSASLAPGASMTCTATYTTTQTDVNAGGVTNTGTATGSPPTGAAVTDSDGVTVPSAQTPAIGMTKSADVDEFSEPGVRITYSYEVVNSGNVSLVAVNVTDPLAGLSAVMCPQTTLAPSQRMTCTATYATTQADVDRGFITNVGTATGTTPTGAVLTHPSTVTIPAVVNPGIEVVKTALPSSFGTAGTTITYSYAVTNTGNVTLTAVDVTDAAPGLSAINCPATTLAPGASTTCTATHVTTQADVDRGSITNTGLATGTAPDGTPETDDSTTTVEADVEPAITVTKSANPASFTAPGATITYSYLVRNTGNVTLTDVDVTDPAPGLSAITCPVSTLAPNATTTCTATYVTTQADVDRGSINNTGTATGTAPDGTEVTNPSSTTVEAELAPAITIVKTANPSTFATANTNITYSYEVTNTGNVTLDAVTVTDPAPGLSTITCGVSALAPSESVTCTATRLTTQADVDHGSVTNIGTATGRAPDGTVVNDTSISVITSTPNPSLSLVKTAGPDSFSNPGTLITYTYTVTNTGNVTLNPVVVNDPLPGLSAVTCPLTSLAPGGIVNCTATYVTTLADVDAGFLRNTATASGTAPDGTVVDDTATFTVSVVQQPAIGLAKVASVPQFSTAGTLVTFSYIVVNSGNVTLDPVTVSDPLPGLSAISCPFTSLAPTDTGTCTATYTTTQADVDNGFITNTGTATGVPPTAPNVTDTSTVVIPAALNPGISITKSADTATFTAANTLITYTYVIENTGNVTLHGVTVNDALAGLSTVSCPADTIAPGATLTCTATYTTTQADVDAGFVHNSATATGLSPDETPVVSDGSEVTIPAEPAPAISVTKSANVADFAAPNTEITFTYLVENTGNVTLDPVAVTDPLPGLSIISCPGTALAPGDTLTCTATYTTTQADVDHGSITNTGTASGTPPSGPAVTDTSEVNIPAASSPAIAIEKSADPSTFAAANTEITYTYVVRNTGNVTLHNVGVTDPLPDLPAVVCPQSTLAPGAAQICTATYTTTQADVDAGSVFNTGTASGTAPDGTTEEDTSSVTVSATQTPAISLVKRASLPSFAAPGTFITYSYDVTNIGNVSLNPVDVTDSHPGLSSVNCPETALAPGASMTCTATYTTTQADVNAGSITNTGTATGTPPTGAAVTAESSATIPAAQSPAIGITKSADVVQITPPGTTITYSYLVVNAGNVDLTAVHVVDLLPGLSAVTCPETVLVPGERQTCTATYTTTQADVDRGFITNIGTATGTAPDDTDVSESSTVTIPAVSNPSITLDKSVVPTSFDAAGTLITYSYVVTNTGNVTLHAVDVTDLAPGLSAVTCPAGPLAPGASVTCTATYTTTQADVDRGSISNTGTATGTAPDGTDVTDDSSTTVPAIDNPAITLVKSANPTSFDAVGTTITYSYLVTNTGNLTVNSVDVSDPAPGLSAISCPVTTLAPSESTTCTATYTTTQTDLDRGSISNTGTATGRAPDGTELTDTSDTTVPAVVNGDISVVKTASTSTFDAAGTTITYSYEVTNTGNVTLTEVDVTDPAPGLSTITCRVTTLAPGASTTCTATHVTTQADVDNGGITNTGTATGTAPDGTDVTDDSTLTVTATQTPAITLTKEAAGSTFASAGSTIIYLYRVENTGNVTLDPVVVTDPMPGLSPISCPLTSLAPGEHQTCTASYTTTQTDVDRGFVANTGTATGTAPDSTQVQDTDSEIVPLVQAPAIAIAKEADIAEFSAPGTVITYSYIVVNNGNVTLDPVTVTDPLPGLSAISCPATSLAPNDEMTCTATYTTTQADVDAGFVTNTGTATGTTPAGTDVNDTSTVMVDATQNAGISLTKTALPTTFSAPDTVITYSYVVTNTGNVTLSPVVVEDSLSGLSTITCPSDTLAPGATLTCTATYTTTQADVDAGFVTNAATVTGTPPNGETPVSDGSEVTVPADQTPAISITKSASVANFDAPNTLITFTYVVENTGNVALDPVSVSDPLAGLSAISCPPASLAPGETLTCTATYTTTQADVDAGSITNTGVASGIPPSGDKVSDTSTVDIPAVVTPALTIEKSADVNSFALPDEQITFDYLVTNTGNVTIDAIAVADSLPGVSAVTCPETTLAPGDFTTCTATYTTTRADLDAGVITNTGTVTGTAPDGTTVTDNDTLDVPAAQDAAITLEKSASVIDFPAAGTPITFTYTVRNVGNVTLTDVGVTDALSGLSAVTCNPAPPATLAPNAVQTCTATYTTTQADVNAGFLTNAATATGTAPDGTTVDDDAAVTLPAIVTPGIKIVKSANVATFDAPGTVITYSYEITNTGNVDLTDVGVTDPMPGLAPSPPSCPVTTLAPNESTTCTATYTTTQGDVDRGSIVNTGTATGRPPTGLPPETDTSTVDIPLSGISITKSADPTTFTTAGTTIDYSYLVTNTGTTVLDPVVVTDPMPGLSAISCPATSLVAGVSMTCSATYITTAADVTAGTITNTGTATGTGPGDTPIVDSDTTTVQGLAAITLVKSADVHTFTAPGTVITYTFVVTNTGAQPVDFTIADPLPGLSALTCDRTTLQPGDVGTCTATYTTTQADVDHGSVSNAATATGTPPGGLPPATDESSVDVPLSAISITKSAAPTGFTRAGETITYSYTVTNTGTAPLDAIAVTDPMPGLTPSPPSCPSTSLAAGASMTCTATYTTTSANVVAGSVSNTGTVTGTGPDDTMVSASDDLTVPGLPAISLVKSSNVSSFSSAGTVITFTFVVTNTGAQPLTTVTITDPLIPASGIVCPPALPLAVGASMTCTATYTTTAADVANGMVRNTATATGTATGFPPVVSASTVVAPFVRAPSEVLGTGEAPAAPVSPITRTPVEVTG